MGLVLIVMTNFYRCEEITVESWRHIYLTIYDLPSTLN